MLFVNRAIMVVSLWIAVASAVVAQNDILSLEERRAVVRERFQKEGITSTICVPDEPARIRLDTIGSSVVRKNKGQLVVPVEGYIGIELCCPEDQLKYSMTVFGASESKVIAIADGLVEMVLVGKKFSSLLITHGSYVSVYSVLGPITVKEGDKVVVGQSVGSCFVENGEPYLKFELWENSERLNILSWFDIPSR